MRTLRERHEQGFSRGDLEFVDAGGDSVIVVAHPSAVGGDEWPAEVATVITFREGKVTSMQDYPTREDALATDKRAAAVRIVGVEPIFTVADVAPRGRALRAARVHDVPPRRAVRVCAS
jgi:hypothetical protein